MATGMIEDCMVFYFNALPSHYLYVLIEFDKKKLVVAEANPDINPTMRQACLSRHSKSVKISTSALFAQKK